MGLRFLVLTGPLSQRSRYSASVMFSTSKTKPLSGKDKLPKNAMLLRTLVLVYFFGPAMGWLLASGWRGSGPEDTSLFRCCFHSMVHLHQRRAVATLLGVFRL